MKHICVLALWLLAGSAVWAQQAKEATAVSDDAVEVLKKSAAALTKVRTVTYTADYKGTKWIAEFVPVVLGDVTIGTRSEHDIDPFLADVKITSHRATLRHCLVARSTAGSCGGRGFDVGGGCSVCSAGMLGGAAVGRALSPVYRWG